MTKHLSQDELLPLIRGTAYHLHLSAAKDDAEAVLRIFTGLTALMEELRALHYQQVTLDYLGTLTASPQRATPTNGAE